MSNSPHESSDTNEAQMNSSFMNESFAESVRERVEDLKRTVSYISQASRTPSEHKQTLRMKPTTMVLLTYMFTLAFTIPIYPTLLLEAVNMDKAMAARWNGYTMIAKSILDFISLPVIGAASDMYGRKPFLIMSLISVSIQIWILVFNGTSLAALVLVRVLAGTSDAVVTLAFAAITDITNTNEKTLEIGPDVEHSTNGEPGVNNLSRERSISSYSVNSHFSKNSTQSDKQGRKRRKKRLSKNYGIVGAVFGVAFVLGPAFGGILSYQLGVTPALAIIGVIVTSMSVYTLIKYEETLDESNRIQHIDKKRFNPFETLTVLLTSDVLRSLSIPLFLYDLAFSVNSTWILWVQFRFGWQILHVGAYLSALGLAIAFFQAFVIRIVPKYLSEKDAIVRGYIACGLYYFFTGLCPKGWMLYFLLLVIGYGSLAGPCLRATLSSHVKDSDQGLLQGALDSVTTISRIIGGLLYSLILSWSEQRGEVYGFSGMLTNGAINFVAALFMIPAVIYAARALQLYSLRDSSIPLIEDQNSQSIDYNISKAPVVQEVVIRQPMKISVSQDNYQKAMGECSTAFMADTICGIEMAGMDSPKRGKKRGFKRAWRKTKKFFTKLKLRPANIISDGRGLM